MKCESCSTPIRPKQILEICGRVVCTACFAKWEPDPLSGPESSIAWRDHDKPAEVAGEIEDR